jgi:alanine racemase
VDEKGRYDGEVKSWIEVSAERLAANYRAACGILQREAKSTADLSPALLAVIKANGYGHGAAVCAPVLARAGAAWLGVTDAAEGAEVRKAMLAAGIPVADQPEILIMCGHLAEDAAAIVQHRLTPILWTPAQVEALAGSAGAEAIAIHIEVDSGMSRQGVSLAELPALLRSIAGEPRVQSNGVMTHFASAEVAGSSQTASQRAQFEAAMELVAASGLRPAWVHAGNTSALDNGADGGTLPWLVQLAQSIGARAMMREGLGLYGYSLPLERLVAMDGDAARLQPLIRPVMTWKARVIGLEDVAAGSRIGYSGTFVADRPMRLALLPIGYADGLRRELSSTHTKAGGWVMIAGRQSRIVGRISMNLTTVDVTGLDGVEVGDEVIVLGEGATADDHAAIAGTIAYEILCGMRAGVVLV